MGEGSESAPRSSLRRAAEAVLTALHRVAGARRARLEFAAGAADGLWILSRSEAGDLSFSRGREAGDGRGDDPHWFPLRSDLSPPEGGERRRETHPDPVRAWIRLDPAPGPSERERLGPSLRLAALHLEGASRLTAYERDAETDLLNRQALLVRLEESLRGEGGFRAALLLLQVGGEGEVTSRLRLASQLARRCLRRRDSLARLEGGILAALLPGADGGEAAAAAGRLQRALRSHEQRVPVAAGGLAVAPHHGHSPTLLLERASRALAEARRREERMVLLYHEGLEGTEGD